MKVLLVLFLLIPFFTIPVFAQETSRNQCSDPGSYCIEKYGVNNMRGIDECIKNLVSSCGVESAKDIDIEILGVKKLELANSDVLMFELSFVNNGNVYADIPLYWFYLVDSKSREFDSSSSFSLRDKDIRVSSNDCPSVFSVDVNPGLSTPQNICYEVPKDIGESIFLKLYEHDPTICSSPFVPCYVITIPYTIKSVQETVKETVKETVQETTKGISTDGGCLIATATYGTELATEVQNLRELRNEMYETELGGDLMRTINGFYYSFSPTVSDWERENPVFKEAVKVTITPMLSSLSLLNYVDMDSESEVLGYGISLILLNIGMYFVLPAIVIHRVRKFV